MKKIIILLYVPFLLLSCELKSKDHKQFKRTSYSNGRTKSEGYYINDSIPVDTIKYFRKNGHLEFIEVYKDGVLNGVCSYYDSLGILLRSKEYNAGILEGLVIDYYPNSVIKTQGRISNNIFIGDVYNYFSNGMPKLYNFFDFKQQIVRVKEYDSISGKILIKSGNVLLLDTIKEVDDTLFFKIVLSHPPYCKNKLLFEELDDSEKVLKSIQVDDSIPYVFRSIVKYHSMNSIRLINTQFDSIAKTTDSSVYIYKSY